MNKLCECGCGQPTSLSWVYHKGIGPVKDGPARKFIRGHGGTGKHYTLRHGHSINNCGGPSREYRSYSMARQRCENRTLPCWPRYGGRGIKFLFTSFDQFFAELGPRPAETTLDRINNDGNYEPGNVRWATYKEQANNKRTPRKRTQYTIPIVGGDNYASYSAEKQ